MSEWTIYGGRWDGLQIEPTPEPPPEIEVMERVVELDSTDLDTGAGFPLECRIFEPSRGVAFRLLARGKMVQE